MCLQCVINILKQMKTNISISEIETSLPFYRENLEFLLDDPQKYNFYNAYNTFILCNECNFNGMVTPEELMFLATKIFIPTNASIICLGDDAGIDKKEIQIILNELKNN